MFGISLLSLAGAWGAIKVDLAQAGIGVIVSLIAFFSGVVIAHANNQDFKQALQFASQP